MLEKKYNPNEMEKKWQEFWRENGIYDFDPESGEEVYSIDTPPPTVSGSLHIGHIFSYTQGEIIARFQRMQGKNVFFPFGFDDNGLPTERLVEREKGVQARDLPKSEFVNMCLDTTKKYVDEFKGLWQSLGFSADWKLQYETISPMARRISQRSFLELAKSGRAYRKEMPVLWCTNCRTSIAQAELESSELETTFNWIPFMVEGEELLVATTRPELLYGCVCLFVHPEDKRYEKYKGKKALVPLYGYEIPILEDEKVSMEKGTGVVMCATFGDTTDMEWYMEYSLPYRKVIEYSGYISEHVPYIGGLKVKEARERIIELLKENNLLRKSESLIHTVSIHERCGKEIEIIPSWQWYIEILSQKERFLKVADEINWYPESMKARYQAWVENLKYDWCISRQRYFGVPFPVWYCKDCRRPMFADEKDLPVDPMETKPRRACSCGCSEFLPEEAVMDTWATSSVTPLLNSRWGEDRDISEKLQPMSLRFQAHEIIRTWAFYTIVKSLYHRGEIPWKDIMLSGFIMAKKGEKISKSKNNAASSPKALVEKYSADAIRYWTAGARLGTDTMFSEDELKTSIRFLTKLWNSAKFTLMHLEDYDGCEAENILPIDRWIIERLMQTSKKACGYLKKYEAGMARKEIDSFFWNDYCDNYLEIVKDRLYKPEIHGALNRRSAQYALYRSFLGILKLYAIFVPHITEEIYQDYYRSTEKNISLHNLKWDADTESDDDILSFGDDVKTLLNEVRKYKSERNLSMKADIESIIIRINGDKKDMLESAIKDLLACTSAEGINIEESDSFGVSISGRD